MEQLQKLSANEIALMAKQAETQFALSPVGQSLKQFEAVQRIGQMYASGTIVPDTYKGNVANCAIAVDLAQRLNMPAMMVMQNLYIVHGNPAWSSKFLIACVNGCGRYTTLEYHEKGNVDTDDYGVRCVAYERHDVKRERPLAGPWVTWKLVKAEGWLNKNGSKWKTMPELMFRYRAAAQWQRTFAPDLGMGIITQEEAIDEFSAQQPAIDVIATEVPTPKVYDPEDTPAPQVSPERLQALYDTLAKCADTDSVRSFRAAYKDEINAVSELRDAVIARMEFYEQMEATAPADEAKPQSSTKK